MIYSRFDNCVYRAWLDQRYLGYAEYVTILDHMTTLEWILIGVGIGVGVVMMVCVGVCLCRRRRTTSAKRRRERGAGAEMVQLRGGSSWIDAE